MKEIIFFDIKTTTKKKDAEVLSIVALKSDENLQKIDYIERYYQVDDKDSLHASLYGLDSPNLGRLRLSRLGVEKDMKASYKEDYMQICKFFRSANLLVAFNISLNYHFLPEQTKRRMIETYCLMEENSRGSHIQLKALLDMYDISYRDDEIVTSKILVNDFMIDLFKKSVIANI